MADQGTLLFDMADILEDEEDSTPPSSPPQPAIARRSKFEDEEDSDVSTEVFNKM